MMIRNRYNRGIGLPTTLVAGAILAVLAVTGFEMLPSWDSGADARISLTREHTTIRTGETFHLSIDVSSRIPVNVFSGELRFDEKVVRVESLEYNTGIADLWVEKPWYENGHGTVNFGGGTTKRGGFSGDGTLITLTMRAVGTGNAQFELFNTRILKHDGLGTDALLVPPLDTLLTIIDTPYEPARVADIVVLPAHAPSPDLNGDGTVSMKDMSIMLLELLRNNPRYDLNGDDTVDRKDVDLIVSSITP